MSEAMIYEISVEFNRKLTEKEQDMIRHVAKEYGYHDVRYTEFDDRSEIYLKNTEAVRGGGREAFDDLYADLFDILPPRVLPAIRDINMYATYIEQAPVDYFDRSELMERVIEDIEMMAEDAGWKKAIESREWNGVKFWFNENGELLWDKHHGWEQVFRALMEILERCGALHHVRGVDSGGASNTAKRCVQTP